jgi:hypothetical protein
MAKTHEITAVMASGSILGVKLYLIDHPEKNDYIVCTHSQMIRHVDAIISKQQKPLLKKCSPLG